MCDVIEVNEVVSQKKICFYLKTFQNENYDLYEKNKWSVF